MSMDNESLDYSEEQEEEQETEALDPAALREQIAAELREQFETEFSGHRAAFEEKERKRISQRLKDTAGIEWTEQDDFRPVDPVRATQFVARGAQTAPDPLDAPISIFEDDADVTAAKIQRQIQRGIEAGLKPRDEQIAQLRVMAQQPAYSNIGRYAKEALETQGLGVYAEHPKFEETVTNAIRQAVDAGQLVPEALHNPQAIAAYTGMLAFGGILPKPEGGTTTPRDNVTGRYAAAQRASLESTRPTRGGGISRERTAFDDRDRRDMEDTGCETEDEFAALAAAQAGGGMAAYQRWYDANERKKAGTRR